MTGGQVVATRWRTLGILGVIALVFSACSGTTASASPSTAAASSPPSTAPASQPAASAATVTIEWWHITTGDPGKTDFQNFANAYMTAHPNVKINITILENEAFKSKLQTAMAAGTPPDLFQSWGGGGMADQADAGMLKDITADVASWKDEINAGAMSIYQYNGKQYGIPWDLGMIGFWYNKDLYAQAGITAPPTTWEEFLADVDKLKAKGITPMALAGKDEWPGMHLWTYLVLRSGGAAALTQMIQSKNWNTDACKAGGVAAQQLVAKKPFQDGYLNAVYDKGEAAAMGNGKASTELMGQWAPSVQNSNSTSGKGIGDKLAWYAFPTVAGGAGAATDAVGGGNGIAVGKNAPPEALDFLHYFVSKDVASKVGADGFGLPVTVGTEGSVTDPQLKDVLANRAKATFVQLYLDQATSAAMGKAINDATAGLFAGKSTPEQVCQAITDAAAAQ
jgi:raffinose/stachyose/melibiose transport system substrate-binding protein